MYVLSGVMPSLLRSKRVTVQPNLRLDALKYVYLVLIFLNMGLTMKLFYFQYLYTMKVQDAEKAEKLTQSLPPGLQRKNI